MIANLFVFSLYLSLNILTLKECSGNDIVPKPGDKNQKPYSKLLILLYDGIKLTVGVQKSTQEKVQYCLTALGSVSK